MQGVRCQSGVRRQANSHQGSTLKTGRFQAVWQPTGFLGETGRFSFGTAINLAYGLRLLKTLLAFEQASRDREHKAHGKATHQHASNALHRAQEAPNWWENYVAIANRRIGGRREIEASLP